MEVIVLIWLFQEFYELTNEEFLICGKCLIHISCCFHESKLSLVPSLVISKGPKRNPGVGTTIKKNVISSMFFFPLWVNNMSVKFSKNTSD